jgi:prepilin-type N-terminal cleavage/methylation domain-containing protein
VPRKTNCKGISLLEVMMAMVILSIVAFGSSAYICSVQKTRVFNRSRLAALHMAQGTLESLTASGSTPVSSTATLTLGTRSYTQTVTVNTVNTTYGTISYSYYQITVSVRDLAFPAASAITLTTFKRIS